jgi:hypothetical protein
LSDDGRVSATRPERGDLGVQLSTDPATLAALQTLAGTGRITEVEAIPFAIPYRRPPAFASGTVSSADKVLVRVHSDAGLVGQVEAHPRPYTGSPLTRNPPQKMTSRGRSRPGVVWGRVTPTRRGRSDCTTERLRTVEA